MFEVILFLATDQVEVVPSSWVSEENGASICYWPPYTKASEFLKAIRQQKPKEDSWGIHPVRCLYKTESIDKANLKRRQAEAQSNLSDLHSEVSDVERSKRRKRHHKHTNSSTSDSSNDEHYSAAKAQSTSRSQGGNSGGHGAKIQRLAPPQVPAVLSAKQAGQRSKPAEAIGSFSGMISSLDVSARISLSNPSRVQLASQGHPSSNSADVLEGLTDLHLRSETSVPDNAVDLTCREAATDHSVSVTESHEHPELSLPAPNVSQLSSCGRTHPPSSTHSTRQSPRNAGDVLTGGGTPRRLGFTGRTRQSPRNASYAQAGGSTPRCLGFTAGMRQSRLNTQNSVSASNDSIFRPDSAALQMLIQQNAEMKEQLRVVTAMLQDILRRQRAVDGAQRGQLPESVQLPLEDYSALEALEQQLESREIYNQLLAYLACVGGVTVKNCTARILTTLLKHELALQLTWCSRTTEKHSVGGLILTKVVIEAVRRNQLTARATQADVERQIKLWFRRAPDRHGGRSERGDKANNRRLLLNSTARHPNAV